MAKEINIIVENNNVFILIEEKVINLQKDINDIRSKSYMSQNFFEKCFEKLEKMIIRTKYVFLVSLKTKNINKIRLDMSYNSKKGQIITNDNNIRIEDISTKIPQKRAQKMPIFLNTNTFIMNITVPTNTFSLYCYNFTTNSKVVILKLPKKKKHVFLGNFAIKK